MSDKVLSCEDARLYSAPLLLLENITLKAFIIHIKPSPSQKLSRLRAEDLNSEWSLSPSQLLCVRHCPTGASDVASDGHQLICSAMGPWPTLHPLLSCTLHGESGCLSPFLVRYAMLSALVHHPITPYGGDKSKQLKIELA